MGKPKVPSFSILSAVRTLLRASRLSMAKGFNIKIDAKSQL